ncbi:IclR family transcriptional regulator [Streptomyces fuscichromogenes]|uniref:IclR family transcriptional regulator n=1 Tax=Streptomyces fuscichromogenes TaxID=1324013 RepID=UPI0038083276
MSEQRVQPRYPIESVGNALVALDLLRLKPSIRVTDLADRLSVARSTAQRLMSSLVSHGLAIADDAGQGYAAGATLLRLGALALDRLTVREVAHPSLVSLARVTGETCELAVLDGAEVLLVDVVEGTHTLRVVDPVGSRAPAHLTAVGKAMLASLPVADLERLLVEEDLEVRMLRSIGTRAELVEQLVRVRADGYASAQMELGDDYVGVAAPVLGPCGGIVAGVTVALPVVRATEDFAATIGPMVAAAGREIGRRLADSLAE